MRLINADALDKRIYNDIPIGFFGSVKRMAAIRTMVEEEPTVTPEPGWISVKDRLPEGGVLVLVAFDVDIGLGETREVDTAMRQEGVFCGGGLDNYLASPCEVDVTHWMPLPEPPKGGEKDG